MIADPLQPGGPDAFGAFLRKLLVADWEDADGPLSLNAELSLRDFAKAEFFINTRLFLAALAEGDGAPATATGNLNRAFVGQLFERLVLPALSRERILKSCKVMNEMDVWPLHLARVVAEAGGLVARRKKRFHLTKAGRASLPEDQAGALYRRVFVAYFRRFDLRYDFNLRKVPGIQQTMAVILWRLHTVAEDWTPVRGLAGRVLMPGVLNELHASMVRPYDAEEWILIGYALNPLRNLGLLERKKTDKWPGLTEHDEIRISPLWRKFIRFNPAPGGAR